MRTVIFIAIALALLLYSYQAIRTLTTTGMIRWGYLISCVLVYLFLVGSFWLWSGDDSIASGTKAVSIGLVLSLMLFQLIIASGLLIEDIVRLVSGLVSWATGNAGGKFFVDRRKFVSGALLAIAAIPFLGMLYGMVQGKYNFRVIRKQLGFSKLPKAFKDYKIVQISDIHIGSFTDKEEVAEAINMVNSQNPDLILFTGDLVNNRADELDGWMDVLDKLVARDGVYSVLGNHDYGDYAEWESAFAKAKNLESLKDRQARLGWRLLLNESVTISRGDDAIRLIGVENWGGGRFVKYGDLDEATKQVEPEEFKILMSHDPSHWDAQVRQHPSNIDLTLSGHTHGMQFGIEIPGFIKWSPAGWIYRQWAGLYQDLQTQQAIYVNRGFGFLGYPGRAGIWPEITVIELTTQDKIT